MNGHNQIFIFQLVYRTVIIIKYTVNVSFWSHINITEFKGRRVSLFADAAIDKICKFSNLGLRPFEAGDLRFEAKRM
jgi:hypothetical protein